MNERSRPIALCSSCGAYSYEKEVINTLCEAKGGSAKCCGFWQNKSRVSDWETCNHCIGTGYTDDHKGCTKCNRSGWLPRR